MKSNGWTSALCKTGLVLGGYAAAVPATTVICQAFARIHPQADPSGGMAAFGDLVLYAGVFGFLALVPTGLALYFLRPWENFWGAFSTVCLAIAAIGLFAVLTMGWSWQGPWVMLGFFGLLKVFAAPLFGLGFLICAALAPVASARWRILAAAGTEFAVSGYAFFCLYFLHRWPR